MLQLNSNLVLFLCLYRTINALLLQTTFDPDEYWQTLEPAYCYAFQRSCALTWEWTRRSLSTKNGLSSLWEQSLKGPVRSHVTILPTYMLYMFLKLLKVDSPFWISKGPVLLSGLVIAAPTDYLVWYLSGVLFSYSSPKQQQQHQWWSLFCSLTSWFQAYALVRTYSNSLETVLLLSGLALLLPEIKSTTCSHDRYSTKTAWAFVLGGLSVAIRFTSLTAWIPLGMYCAYNHSRLDYLLFPCAFYGIVGFAISLVVDRIFYGFWTIPLLGNLHFNIVEGMGALYGTHPVHWYLSAGLPAITGLMLPIILVGCMMQQHSRKMTLIWIIVVPYVLLHSISEHKEFRFLLPILPLLCTLSGSILADKLNLMNYPGRKLLRNTIILTFVTANLIAFLYLGLIHQRGPIDINQAIVRRIQQSNHSDVSVHYLTECHSTPMYSHLHVRGVNVTAWYLDCSPTCRASETLVCESSLFAQDPLEFVLDAYGISNKTCSSSSSPDEDQVDSITCAVHQAAVPNFVVMFASDAIQVDLALSSIGLVIRERFFHTIVGATIFGLELGSMNGNVIPIAPWLTFAANEMILYERL